MANNGGPRYGFTYGPAPIDTTPRPINRRPGSGPSKEPGVPVTSGVGQHAALAGNSARVRRLPGMMTREQVYEMQRFLVNHGFNISQDGVLGPLTKSAAAAFRANHKGGEAWNRAHGIGVHPAHRSPVPRAGSGIGDTASENGDGPGPSGGSLTPPASPMLDSFNALLTALLKGGGKVGAGYDPGSFGDAAAAPDTALAKAISDQIALNPAQEKQNQYDLSSWYGLDPNDPNFKISVLGRLATAKDRNAQVATDTAGNVSDIAKSLAGSIGGAANGASGTVLAAGADASGLAKALGQSDEEFANDMSPLLAAEARGQMSREKASNAQALQQLRDRLGQAQGQAQSDRAQGVMAAQDKNNALGQQRFANEGNLLSTLSQLLAVDPTANSLDNAKTVAEINKIMAQTNAIQHPGTKVPTKVDLAQAGNSIAGLLGVGPDHKLPPDVSPTKLAYTIGSQLQALGFTKGTPEYQRYGQQLISMFRDPNGTPFAVPRSWFGPGS